METKIIVDAATGESKRVPLSSGDIAQRATDLARHNSLEERNKRISTKRGDEHLDIEGQLDALLKQQLLDERGGKYLAPELKAVVSYWQNVKATNPYDVT